MFNAKVFFEEINGKKVFQILTMPQNTKNKIVIMSHGFRGSSVGPARTFVDFERMLLKNNYSVLRFDQPNSGNSEGDFINSSFNEWVYTLIYLAKKYLDLGYEVALLGQSMGATTTMIASGSNELLSKIPCIILWVPDPKSTFDKNPNDFYKEGSQKYKGIFWQQAKDSNFFDALEKYSGGIHLVYGEKDRYIENDLKEMVIKKIESKGQPIMILKGEDHSDWDFDTIQNVYKEELEFLDKYLA